MKRAYLGIDVGSVSTNVALVDEEKNVLDTLYTRTHGDPKGAVERGLAEIGERAGGDVEIRGAATTGSARRFTGVLVGADIVKNEIIAHATAAIHFYDDARTVFEIGGQDSKLIVVEGGVVVDFAMNTVCAAGTGSFLDQQASRLGIPIEEFGRRALASDNPVRIASKCTVFAESDMIHKAQLGVPTDDIIAGLCEGIVRNYLNNVGKGKRIRERVVFQGGVSNNAGVRRAFEKELSCPVTVPEHNGVMGAIGVALLARRHVVKTGAETAFLGFELGKFSFQSRAFECEECSNLCEVVELVRGGKVIDRYGHRCSRWDIQALV